MKQAKILFVSYYCHSQTLTATRNYYLSQALAEAGHEVHVLGRETNEVSTSSNVHKHVVHAWDYRKLLIALGVKEGVTSTVIPPGRWIQWGYNLLLKYPFNIWFGEGGGWYFRRAVKQGLNLINQFRITHVFSSYRPIADHFIADQLKHKYPALIWIADFRDVLWWESTNSHYQQQWIRQLVSHMDHITAVTRGIGSFWGNIYHRQFIPLYNGLPDMSVQQPLVTPADDKFILNYTGRIYTEFQRADTLFEVLNELIAENNAFAKDVMIHYSGIHAQHWQAWIKQFGLSGNSIVQKQLPIAEAWYLQSRAHINLVLTWTTKDITGFIHGKFNEYLAMKKPILCIVAGTEDFELEAIYADLTNSLLVYNRESDKERIRRFVFHHYEHWKKTGTIEQLDDSILFEYTWSKKAKPLLDLIESPI